MSNKHQVTIPDLGGSPASVIEVLVKVGDQVAVEAPLLTLEGDKATMEVPSSTAGVVHSIDCQVGDQVSEGGPCVTLITEQAAIPVAVDVKHQAPEPAPPKNAAVASDQPVQIPDLGGGSATLIEWLVKPGDQVEVDSPLLTLEGEKATMEVPSPIAGIVKQISLKVGDSVQAGDQVGVLSGVVGQSTQDDQPKTEQVSPEPNVKAPKPPVSAPQPVPAAPPQASASNVYAGPSVRRYATELGIDLARVSGSGAKGRIIKDDLKAYIQGIQQGGSSATRTVNRPVIDFSQFGPIETQPLTKINQLSGQFLTDNWASIPHVTQFMEADITDLEKFRQDLRGNEPPIKVSVLLFIIKAWVETLQKFAKLNASLSPCGTKVILKQYYHIGVAVDTPQGLLVPVVRDVDQLSITALGGAIGQFAKLAKAGKLSPKDMQGSTASVSSLGGIGGHYFTPIINAPDVAILGVSRAYQKAVVYQGTCQPRWVVPLSLSYDHRVIDGALGAQAIMDLSHRLEQSSSLIFRTLKTQES